MIGPEGATMTDTRDGAEAPDPRRTIAIVDDHTLFADALRAWTGDNLPHVRIVYAGPDPAAVPAGTDLVLLDIDLGPGASPAEAVTADLVASGSAVLLVSAVGEPGRIRPALSAGASGYVPKRVGSDVLTEAIETALLGEMYLSPDLAAVMVAAVDRPSLSQQELTALRLYASGLKLDAVARRMGISASTAREYLLRVRRKYADVGRQVRTKTDLYAAAVKDGIIQPDE
jgi:DNA-binding NarL/FixJ family response regulator